MKEIVYRRKIFEQVYDRLTAIQRSYTNIIQELTIKIMEEERRISPAELDITEKEIITAKNYETKIENIKFLCSLALLSEGSLITGDELSYIVEAIDGFLEGVKVELEYENKYIVEWATTKKEYYEHVKRIILDILNHKLKRQTEINGGELH